MKTSITLLVSLVTYTLSAQQHINQEFATQMNAAFQLVEKQRVPHGLLQDYAFEFTELAAYNGVLSDTNAVTPVALKQLYHTLFTARIHPSADGAFISPQEYEQRRQSHRTEGVITLSGLYYQYSRLQADALATNNIQVVNNQLVDQYSGGVWQNPYETARSFAIAPSVRTYKGYELQVVFPQELWLSNQAALVQSLELDAGDGLGYRTLPFDQSIALTYTEEGLKQWTYRLTLSTGETLYAHSKIYIERGLRTWPHCPNCESKPAALEASAEPVYGTEHITATTAYNGAFGSATLLIDYADADEQVRNPLIVVEGFDPGILIDPEAEFGITDIEDFLNIIEDSQSGELGTLLSGNTQAYDIIYVNWDNGVDYLQRNAYVLQAVISWVNQQKAMAGSVEPNVVWGQSMGGVIARYALADMEQNGLPHDTALFISHDAPHQGANIPLGYQYFSRHALHQYVQSPLQFLGGEVVVPLFTDGVSPLDYLLLQNTPAARQMLINYVDVDYSINNSVHEAWQQELLAQGYPAIRNIALSNGSHCAALQNAGPGELLFSFDGNYSTGWLTDILLTIFPGIRSTIFEILSIFTAEPGFLVGILPGGNKLDVDFDVHALPASGSSQLYRGRIVYTKKLLWLVNINVTLTDEQFNAAPGTLPYDSYPGGVYDTGLRNSTDTNDGNFWQQLLFKYDMAITTEPTFSFVPTASALDIGRGAVSLNNADYVTKYNAETLPVAPKDTPFDNFTSSFQNSFVVGQDGYSSANEPHIGLHLRNGNWLAAELNAVPQMFNCSFMCDDGSMVISGSGLLCGGGVYSVPVFGDGVVNWSVSDPSAVLLAPAGGSVNLTAVNGYRTAVTLTATITSANCNRVLQVPKTIWVGPPAQPAAVTGPTVVVTGALVNYQGSVAPGATSYQWFLPGVYQTVASYDYLGNPWQKLTTATTQSVHVFTGWGKHNGSVQVAGVNACGCGGARSLYVAHVQAGGGVPPAPGGGIPKFSPDGDLPAQTPVLTESPLLLYPNPSRTFVTLKLTPDSVSETTGAPVKIRRVQVFDNLGRPLYDSSFSEAGETEVQLNIAHWASGTYRLLIATDAGYRFKNLVVE